LVHVWRFVFILLLHRSTANLLSPPPMSTLHTCPILLLLSLLLRHLFVPSTNSFSQELLRMSEQFLEALAFGGHELAMGSFAKPLGALGTG